MSQQGPGGYGGGGPYGPPGGGGGYGGPPPGGGYPRGAPPGGYGPPGQPPGGYGGPPGYGPPGYGPPGGPPPGPAQYGGYPGGPGQPPPKKKSNALLFVVLGVGVLVLLGIGGAVASFLYVRNQANQAEQQIAAAASGVAAGVSAVNGGAAVSPACARAIACCKIVDGRSGGQNAELIERACGGLGALSDAVCAQQHDAQKRAATLLGLTCP